MQKRNHVQYLYDGNADMELILCRDSAISYPLHNHVSVFTIGFVLRGSIFLTAGGHASPCGKDSFFTILPYVPHAIEARAPYSLLTLCINKDSVSRRDQGEIRSDVRRLLAAACDGELTENQTIQLLNGFDFLERELPLYSAGEHLIDSAKEQIERCPERKLSIDEMARSLYMSKYHFIRSFKRAVGLTPHQFLIQNRVRKAQHMLYSFDSLTEVALAAGFCDQSHFIKHFERYVGLTPAAYKRSSRRLT